MDVFKYALIDALDAVGVNLNKLRQSDFDVIPDNALEVMEYKAKNILYSLKGMVEDAERYKAEYESIHAKGDDNKLRI